ncbi:hypothetical protein [Aquimarina algicola]|uniref:T9SS C-terminal target domain-containing protein n=1 Tax=Aquimarina algicola TaxID=2589995 RepID=A0A504JBS0_9FLAO|nr:hypothetical protein [Aquimarina algicola]TPN85992.1 hypothetical protein FHK87_12000 [Aquimarina algicola]
MKKRYFLIACISCFLFSSFIAKAQNFNANDLDWTEDWTNFSPNRTNYPEAEEKLPNIIDTHTFLTNDVVYLISGDVYVTNNASLTIQEGTVVRCDYENPANLIITKGSKLIAAGSKASPIVFTSAKPPKSRNSGDWGGIIIAGSATVNTVSGGGSIDGDFLPQYSVYGGNYDEEETTVLRYVRIEYPGNQTKRKQGINGLSLYALGTSSIIEDVMVSYAGKDSYDIHGGKNNLKNLISYKAVDDDYQVAEGFRGTFNQIMAVRHPYINSPQGSYALEVDGYNKQTGYIRPNFTTDVTITNATFVNLSDKSNYQHTTAAISIKHSGTAYVNNSKISGFSDIVKFDNTYTSLAIMKKAFMMDNSFFNIHGTGVEIENTAIKGTQDILKYNRFTKDFVSVNDLFNDPQNKVSPRFNLKQSLNNYMVMQ